MNLKQRVCIALIACSTALFFWNYTSVKPIKIKPYRHQYSLIKEPSDICKHPYLPHFFVVSDNGFLYEVDSTGHILRKADFEGYDTEGVFADSFYVYVVEEMVRKIRVFDIQTLKLSRTVNVPYSGGRNKGYEAITFNPQKGLMLLFTEKDPLYLFELNADLLVVNEIRLNKIARDISAATFYKGRLFVLSDEDREVIELSPDSYRVIQRWKLPVINPEGLVFTADSRLIILSDDREKWYFFDVKHWFEK
jgi:uncharacterized protein YjiK